MLLVAGFGIVSSIVNQVYAYPYLWWGAASWSCPYMYYYAWFCPYASSWYYPYYYGYSYPYSYGYSYYDKPAQAQLTVNVDPSNLQNAVTGAGSYGMGTSATFSANQNVIQVSQNTRYIFSHWSGDYTGQSLNGTLTMDSAKTVTAVYQLQYYLEVNSPANVTSVQGTGWYNAGNSTTLIVPSLIVGGTDSRFVFNGWNLDGVNGTMSSTLTVQMNAPHTVTPQYKQQYYLTVMSNQGGSTSGTGWYDAGAQVQISASTPQSPAYGIAMVFSSWNGTVATPTSQSTTVLMDGPKTVTATWRADATVLYATIISIIAVVVVTVYLLATRRKAASPSLTPDPKVEEPQEEIQKDTANPDELED